MNFDLVVPWTTDWLWGLPLSVATVVFHVFGLNLIRTQFHFVLEQATRRTLALVSLVFMAATTLSVTILHGIEAYIWALGYRLLNALPDQKTAVLFSLNAMTTFGHSGYNMEGQWHLMGALEALNGWILFGLSTAFLYAINQKVWRLAPELEQRVIARQEHEVTSSF